MNTETRTLKSLLRADLSTWGVGAVGACPKTGEELREGDEIGRWCEWAPKVILANVWPRDAHGREVSEVAIYLPFLERAEDAQGWPPHARVYQHAEVFGDDKTEGVIALCVTAELWEKRRLWAFIEWALNSLYPRYERLKGEAHRCEGRVLALRHILHHYNHSAA